MGICKKNETGRAYEIIEQMRESVDGIFFMSNYDTGESRLFNNGLSP